MTACLDCGKPYSDFPLDTVLPDEQWRMIHDSEGGLLCANCMVARLAKLPGAVAVRMRLEFAKEPPYSPSDAEVEAATEALHKSLPNGATVYWIHWGHLTDAARAALIAAEKARRG